MRFLYYVVAIHDFRDMAPQHRKMAKSLLGKMYGQAMVKKFSELSGQYWIMVEKEIERLGFFDDAYGLRVFVDGMRVNLPQSEMERLIFAASKDMESPMAGVIWNLIQKGGSVQGTEDPILIDDTLRYLEDAFTLSNPQASAGEYEREGLDYLTRDNIDARDKFVASEINGVVGDSEQAVLFMGALHEVAERLKELSSDFKIVYVLEKEVKEILCRFPWYKKSLL